MKVNNAGGAVIQDQTGALVEADGTGRVVASNTTGAQMVLTATGTAQLNDSTGNALVLTGGTATLSANLNVTGTITATGLITSDVDVALPSGVTLGTDLHDVIAAPGVTGTPIV